MLKHKLKRLLWYGTISTILISFLSFWQYDVFEPWFLVFSFTFGLILGVFEQFIGGVWFSRLSTPLQLLVRFVYINLVTVIVILIFASSDPDAGNTVWNTAYAWSNSDYFGLFYESLVVSVLLILYFQTEALLGQKTYRNYLIGRYSKPKEEERVFMFLDLKDSTAIAERLGHAEYYQLLNDCYRMMTPSVLETDAEILKYIGDEVVFTWPIKQGVKRNNCVNLFWGINEELEKHRDYFTDRYGAIPEYRAGLHCGLCMSAQIGHLKKAIDYSGDTLNTAARIQSECAKQNAQLLISDELLNRLISSEEIVREHLGPINFKGKSRSVDVSKLELAKAA